MKKFLFALLCILLFTFSSQGPNFPGTMADAAGVGSVAWVNPNNAKTENGVSAVCVMTADVGAQSHALKSTNYGFSIPSGSTINGIFAEWKASYTATGDGTGGDNYLQVILPLGNFPDGGVEVSSLTTSLAFYQIGGSTNLWGGTYTYSDINDSNFGFYLQVIDRGDAVGDTYNVDVMQMTIYYTTASGTKRRVIGQAGNKTQTELLSFSNNYLLTHNWRTQ